MLTILAIYFWKELDKFLDGCTLVALPLALGTFLAVAQDISIIVFLLRRALG